MRWTRLHFAEVVAVIAEEVGAAFIAAAAVLGLSADQVVAARYGARWVVASPLARAGMLPIVVGEVMSMVGDIVTSMVGDIVPIMGLVRWRPA